MSRTDSISKAFEPHEAEPRIYAGWMKNGYFGADADPDKRPYCIVMPPPNITGQLHLGHALDNTLQDILVRFKRMQGFSALWLPGTDHAAIATEARIVASMKEEGISKEDIGREKFLERAWAWREKFGSRIVEQLKRLGSSCDWSRERFTMDTGLYEAVTEVFIRYYEKGLIEVSPLAFMRGRTLDDAFILLDEAQNTTVDQMIMFLTRIGMNSKACVCGDITQIDLPSGTRNGLSDAINVLSDVKGIASVFLTSADIVRNPIVQKIVLAYRKDRALRKEDANEQIT